MKRVLEPEVMDTAEEADGYDEMDHAGPNESFVDRLIELGARGVILDIGTGPGHVPILVCERIPETSVTGIDLADNMLRHAERHRVASACADRIEYRKADAKNLPFANASFDTVYSNTILHHIPDPKPFLSEARRVLKPGGALLIRDLYRPDSLERVDELVGMHAGDANAYQRGLFHASLCAAFTPDELRELADECGLGEATIVIDSDRHVSLQRPSDA